MEDRSKASSGTSNDVRKPLVLIVDDDADLRAVAQLQLEQDFVVIQAADGAAAIRAANESQPDVILLDIMMPAMNGAQVLTALSEDPSTRDIPVIFLSALTTVEDKVRGLNSGAIDYITKPVDSTELLARVGAAARRKTREEEMKVHGDEDVLTALGIKAAFEARLVQEVARSSRSSAPLSVMVVDVDDMDAINEHAGRHGGDEALRAIAHSLIEGMRGSDGVFRYGGDEFAAVLPDTDVATAHMAAERCRASIADLDVTGGAVSVSIGVAEYSTGRKAEEIVAKAEIALFRAKESGGNRCWRADDPRKHGINPTSLSQELTDREWAVLAHLANRRTEADIARRLNIRAGTVRSHKARIRRKLHVDPDIRLADFARTNFRDLIGRLDTIDEQAG